MINLLPDEIKRQIRAGHTNANLVKYMIILGIALLFLAGIAAGAYASLTNSDDSAQSLINASNVKAGVYSSVQAQATALTSSLANAKAVLDKQVSYSKVLIGIAQVLPTGVIIDSLTLNDTTLGTPITLQAYAKTTADALALKQQLQNSPLFSNVSFQTILPTGSTASGDGYPVGVSFTLTINKAAAQ
jgi:Tfp pilus assembly protein PilN